MRRARQSKHTGWPDSKRQTQMKYEMGARGSCQQQRVKTRRARYAADFRGNEKGQVNFEAHTGFIRELVWIPLFRVSSRLVECGTCICARRAKGIKEGSNTHTVRMERAKTRRNAGKKQKYRNGMKCDGKTREKYTQHMGNKSRRSVRNLASSA